jgi:uncharacterized LabA/DUF88 family protein
MEENKNYAFVDSQNLNLGIKSSGWKIDFQRFRVYLKDKYSVEKAFLFIGYIKGNEKLYADLQKFGYICIFKPTLELPDGKVKGNVDAELVLHTILEKDNYEKAVIVSGDGDFHCLVDHLIDVNKLEVVLIPNEKKYSSLLKQEKIKPFLRFVSRLENKLKME